MAVTEGTGLILQSELDVKGHYLYVRAVADGDDPRDPALWGLAIKEATERLPADFHVVNAEVHDWRWMTGGGPGISREIDTVRVKLVVVRHERNV